MRPRPRVQSRKHTSVVTTVTPEITRHSPRNGFTAYFVLSPAIGLFCHRHLARLLARLDTGVEAPGPHDFAVRFSAIRQARIRVHRIPFRVRDVRTPLLRQNGGSSRSDLPEGESEIFLQSGLDSPNQLDRAGEFSFLAQ
jgi:hypothetical protein